MELGFVDRSRGPVWASLRQRSRGLLVRGLLHRLRTATDVGDLRTVRRQAGEGALVLGNIR